MGKRIDQLPVMDTLEWGVDQLPILDVDADVTKSVTPQLLAEGDPNRPTDDQKNALAGSAFGDPPSSENPFVTTTDDRVGGKEFTAVAYGDTSFTANGGGTWTVDSGDFISYRWMRLNAKLISIKGVILNSSVAGVGTEMRISAPPGITFGGTDSFGYMFWSVDGFVTQMVGSAIARAASNWIALKKHDSTAWGTVTDLVGAGWNMVVECSVVPDATEG